jgi:type III restriction enzyme
LSRNYKARCARGGITNRTGHASQGGGFGFEQHNRDAYYASTHLQTIQFALAQRIVAALAEYPADGSEKHRRVLRLQSRHQLFPQVYRYVEELRESAR